MSKVIVVALAIFLSISLFGCGKKDVVIGESQEQLSMDNLTAVGTTVQPATEAKAPEAKPEVAAPAEKLEPLPPAGPYKPAAKEIQTALKNAGFYTGEIDGKLGPMSKKAIEEFQQANGLQVDGKVGPKTWAALSKYLNAVADANTPASR